MSFYTYQPLQQLILPNTLFLKSELFSYKLSAISHQLSASFSAISQLISYQLAYSLFLPNRAIIRKPWKFSILYNPNGVSLFWTVVCTTRNMFSKVFSRQIFFTINSLQNLHISHTISQTLSSSPHVHSMQNVFPSLTFHKKRLLWKLRGYMTGQRGRQRAGTKHSLSGCHVDH